MDTRNMATMEAASTPRFSLADCRRVSVCDLSGAERFIVWAIRWRVSNDDSDPMADSCLEDAFDRAGLRAVQPAFERFVAAACPHAATCRAADRLGCWRLEPVEAHALHAIACLQAGLLGEAWKASKVVVSISTMWPHRSRASRTASTPSAHPMYTTPMDPSSGKIRTSNTRFSFSR